MTPWSSQCPQIPGSLNTSLAVQPKALFGPKFSCAWVVGFSATHAKPGPLTRHWPAQPLIAARRKIQVVFWHLNLHGGLLASMFLVDIWCIASDPSNVTEPTTPCQAQQARFFHTTKEAVPPRQGTASELLERYAAKCFRISGLFSCHAVMAIWGSRPRTLSG